MKTIWSPVHTAPYNKILLVRGPSQCLAYPVFYISAIRSERRNDEWFDVCGTALIDYTFAWNPLEWTEIPK